MLKDDDFKLLRGFEDEQIDEQMNKLTDFSECRVAFAIEKSNTLNIDYSTYD